MSMDWFQSNSETVLIEEIHRCVGRADWIIINAAGYTHTSVALRDALSLFPGGVIEVHISNIHKRSIPAYIVNCRHCPRCDCWLRPRLILHGS